jgi:hypothetical protein
MLPIKYCIPLLCLISANAQAQIFAEHINPNVPFNSYTAAARDEAYPYSQLPTEVYPSCPYYQNSRCPSPYPACPYGPFHRSHYAAVAEEIYPYNPKTQSFHTFRYSHVSDEGYYGNGYSNGGGCSSCRGHD